MTFLYVTGTFMTLTGHDWATWEFARNVTFNFFGYSFLIYGCRVGVGERIRDPVPRNRRPGITRDRF